MLKPVRLAELSVIRVSNVDKKTHAAETPVRLCNYMDVYSNDYVTDRINFMAASASNTEIERFRLMAGDILITKDSETPDDIGVPAVLTDDIDLLVCGYHLCLIRPNQEVIHPAYLSKLLSIDQVKSHFRVNASGSTRYGLPIGSIEGLELQIHESLFEQFKIAEVLTTVDQAIEQTEALIAKQQRIKTGLMQDLLTRGIDEHGNLRSEETHEFKDSPLGRIPAEWDVCDISSLFQLRREHGIVGLPVMSIAMRVGLVERESLERRVESELKPESHALVKRGDIAYNMMRMWQGVLGLAKYDCLVSPAYVVLKPADGVSSRFFEWQFRDLETVHKFHMSSRGVVDDRLRLYPQDLFGIQVRVPNTQQEQEQIADRIEAFDQAIKDLKKQSSKLLQVKAGLMQDLLTGEVPVTPLLELAETA